MAQIPVEARSAFNDEVWEENLGGLRSALRWLMRAVQRSLTQRTPVDWLVNAPKEIILFGGLVRSFTLQNLVLVRCPRPSKVPTS